MADGGVPSGDWSLVFGVQEGLKLSANTSLWSSFPLGHKRLLQKTTGKPTTYVHQTPDEDFNLILWRAWQEARDAGGDA